MVRSVRAISFVFLVMFGLCSAAHAASFFVVVPNGATSVNGNTSDGLDDTVDTNSRLQWLYGGGQFFSSGGPIWIDQMSFRADPGSGPVAGSAANLDIYLSTSARFPNLNGGAANLMSTTFADNVGPDNLLVYSGPLTLSSLGCAIAGDAPCPFDMLIDFDTPFYYDPSQGRLLADLWFTSFTGESGSLNAVDFSPNYGSIAELFALEGEEAAEGLYPGGDVTRFRYTSAVPEPSAWSLLLLGSGAVGFLRRRKRL